MRKWTGDGWELVQSQKGNRCKVQLTHKGWLVMERETYDRFVADEVARELAAGLRLREEVRVA